MYSKHAHSAVWSCDSYDVKLTGDDNAIFVVSINRIASTSISSLVKDAVLKQSAHCKLYMHCLDTTFYSPCVQKYIQSLSIELRVSIRIVDVLVVLHAQVKFCMEINLGDLSHDVQLVEHWHQQLKDFDDLILSSFSQL